MSEYKLVPVEPTEEMTDEADNVFHTVWKAQREYSLAKSGKEAFASYPFSVAIYKAMLSASPTTDTITIDRTEYEAMKADAERLNTLMDMSGEYYQESIKHQFVGRLREFIDLHSTAVKQAIDQARKI